MNSSKNTIIDKERMRTIDAKRILYFLITIFSFLFTEAGRYIYRPFIYENNINDFGLADSIGNWGGIVVQIFFGLAILNPSFKLGLRVIGIIVSGYLIYEVLQPYLPKGTFDWLDIYGTLIGGFIGLILYYLIQKLVTNNKVIYQFKK